MKSYNIGYIILHYLTYDVTVNCVENIKQHLYKDDIIVIIDNGSNNGTGLKLRQQYEDNNNICVILNNENLGFAKGNNIGFEYLKKNYNMDIIVMMNNDVLLEQKDWRERLVLLYNQEKFDLMGPEILDASRNHTECNPQEPIHTTIKRVRFAKFMNNLKYMLSYIGIDNVVEKISYIITKHGEHNIINKKNTKYNVQLAGCCWIFGKRYIELFDGINPGTFLYLEEQILYYRIFSNNMKSMYSPYLEVVHLEDMSTNAMFKGKTSKMRRFKYRCQKDSFEVLLDEIKKNNNKRG